MLKNKEVEVTSNVRTSSSNLLNQKIADIQKSMNDLHTKLKTQLDISKKGISADDNCSFRIASWLAMPASAQQPPYDIMMRYCAGQTLPLQASQPSTAGPIGLVQ